MTPFEDALIAATKDTALTPGEKAAGRMTLIAAIGLHGIETNRLRLSEADHNEGCAVLQDAIAGSPTRGPIMQRVHNFLRLPAIAMGLVLSTGLAVAANNTIPGDSLYSMKISVIEPIIAVIQPTSRLRAAWEVNLLNRRLWELDEISARREANEETARNLEFIENQLKEQAVRILDVTGALPDESSKAELRKQAQDAINAHTEALRRTLVEKANDGRRLPLESVLTILEENGRSLTGEPGVSSSSSSRPPIVPGSETGDKQPDRGEIRVTVPLPSHITITTDPISSKPIKIEISSPNSSSQTSSSSAHAAATSSRSAPTSSSSGASVSSTSSVTSVTSSSDPASSRSTAPIVPIPSVPEVFPPTGTSPIL